MRCFRLQVYYDPHVQSVPALAVLLGIADVDRAHVEAALSEPGVLHQRPTDAAGPDDHDAVGAAQAEDVAQPRGELAHGIAQPALAERAEKGQVLAHLGGGGTAAAGEVSGRDGGVALPVRVLKESEVE